MEVPEIGELRLSSSPFETGKFATKRHNRTTNLRLLFLKAQDFKQFHPHLRPPPNLPYSYGHSAPTSSSSRLPMSSPRIPYRSPNVLPPGIPPLNLFKMWAHSPSTLPHVISLGTVVFRDTSLSPYLRELVCLLNAKRLHCEYQWKQHVQIARHTSVEEAKIAALAAGNISGDIWSTEEKALLAFTDEVIGGPEVSDAAFVQARKYYSDQILVEVVTMQVRIHSLLTAVT